MTKKQMSNTICYVAFGDFYIAQALLSIKSLRKFDNYSKILLLTNMEFDLSKFNFWDKKRDEVHVFSESLTKNRNYKTNIVKYVETEKAAYIDSDTIVLNKFDKAWEFLDFFDICFKFNPVKQKKTGKGDVPILDKKFKVKELPHFNGGMFFFNNSKVTKEFFKNWNQSFKKHKSPYDQISLNESLFSSKVRVLPLTAEWNYFPDLNYFKGKVRNPIILHYTNRISYVIENELLNIAKTTNLNLEKIKKKIVERRIERKKKIGRLEWYKLKLCWIVMYNHEKKRLNLN